VGVILVGFEFDRRHVVKLLVDSPVVEPFDVVEGSPVDVFDIAPGTFAMNQFSFIETIE
jgi:hypothetical protein